MIGLLFLIGIVLWLIAAIMICANIPRWLGVTNNGALLSVLLFPVILAAPVADEIIGRWQFNRLCEREAVVTLSPDWENVKRASQEPDVRQDFDGYLIPIHSWGGDIVDVDTGRVFFTSKSLFTRGGFLFGRLGLGLDSQATSCHPVNIQAIQKQVKLFELLKQGENK